MEVKTLLNNPEQVIAKRWGSLEQCPDSLNILDSVKTLTQIQSDIKAVKTQKQLCSKSFKEAKGDSAAIAELKQQMQDISAKLNQLTEQKKQQENTLKQWFATPEAGDAATEKQCLQFSAIEDHAADIDINDIDVVQIDDNSATAWDEYVTSRSNACLYHQYSWRTLIAKSFGHQSYYFAAYYQGDIVGILPTTRLTSRLFGDFAVSVPYFNYGGVLANSSAIAEKLLTATAKLYRAEDCSHLEVRTTHAALNAWPNTTDKVSMIRPLPNTTDELDTELGTKIRAQIKRAQKENTSAHIGGLDLLDDFYTVFARNMRDLGTPVYSKSFFANILEQHPKRATIVIIKLNKKPVAAAFLLGYRDMLEIPWASTLKEANPFSINMQLYWEVLSFAIREQYAFFDFGRSTKDANTYRFKKQWGAKPVQHYWYYWLNEHQELPQLKPDNPKFKLAITLWKKMPIWLTKIIGPFIVKNLP
jgi:FemAB-related protein (PEP-CTERM system-associated)